MTRIAPALLLFAAVFVTPVAAQDVPATLTVTGRGTIAQVPDMAMLDLGVVTQDTRAGAALAANSAQLAAVIDSLTAAGIAETDIQTRNLSVSPLWSNQYGNDDGPPRITGYSVTNEVAVRVRDLSILGDLLDVVAGDGANSFQNLGFGLSDPDPALNDARRAAMADALARADLYAEAGGFTIKGIQSVSEGGDTGPQGPMLMGIAEARAVPVAQGEVTTATSVTVVFLIDG
jgi:hypothetical protein